MMYSVLEYLENSAAAYPDKIAFEDTDEAVSFLELQQKAKCVGTALSALLPPGSPVPVLLSKSVKAVIVFLGAVYAGCFYSMLDQKQPVSRLTAILDTLDARLLVTDHAWTDRTGGKHAGTDSANTERVLTDNTGARGEFRQNLIFYEDLIAQEADEELLAGIRAACTDKDLLYVNFTSGSTGIPKGVAVSHRSVIDFIECFVPMFHITKEDRIGNQAPFDFDVSVKDIYSTLKSGATMVLIPQRLFSIPTALIDYLVEREVTTLIWAVSALTLLSGMRGLEYRVPSLVKRVIFSGEVMPVRQLKRWMEALPDAEFYNVYGPTEITCNCTWYKVDRSIELPENIPIGKPFPNEKVFLLDEEDHLVDSPGSVGEICVGGTALSLGYYRNAEETAKAFVQNPLNDRYRETVYRTGDLASYTDSGDLIYLGRKDFQIKHMGHRIELPEIEKAMHRVPGIEEACCIFQNGRITAFYAGGVEKKELVREMKKYLPAYMVPNVFICLEKLPLSKNGKIDRRALSELCPQQKQQA